MSFSAGVCYSFKQEILAGTHLLTSDTIKIALYTQAGMTNGNFATLAAYSTTGEVSGSGYTAGGVALTGATISISGAVAYITFTNPTWSASLTADACLIYNASKSNKAIAIYGFNSTTSFGTFTVVMPPAGTTAIITVT